MKFQEMGLRDELQRAIVELKYSVPTPVQERAIPRALEGRDLICCAQTGTGKTAAFGLPILQRLAERDRAALRAIVLVPTRELALQVDRNICEYGKYLDVVSTTVYGGVPIEPQEMMLRNGVDILVATPGRLIDHMWRGNIDYRHTEYLVLDEADRMLDMGFIDDVSEIVQAIPTERQSMLFSATLDREIRKFAKGILKDPLRIEVAPPATTLDEVDQVLVRVMRKDKASTLEKLIRRYQMKRAIIFARTKTGASSLAGRLKSSGCRASAIHSDRSQSDRVRTLEAFREGRIHLLVATDIAARGIDVDDISHIVNYDLPFAAGDYVHRIGRTARAGRRGMAISFVTPDETQGVEAIERLISKKLTWLDERGPRGSAGSGRLDRGTAGGGPEESLPGNGNGKTRRGRREAHGGNGKARRGNGRDRRRDGRTRSGPGHLQPANARTGSESEGARSGSPETQRGVGRPWSEGGSGRAGSAARPGNGRERRGGGKNRSTASGAHSERGGSRSGKGLARRGQVGARRAGTAAPEDPAQAGRSAAETRSDRREAGRSERADRGSSRRRRRGPRRRAKAGDSGDRRRAQPSTGSQGQGPARVLRTIIGHLKTGLGPVFRR
jgi:ATP-dependent RNA helicase RhlE